MGATRSSIPPTDFRAGVNAIGAPIVSDVRRGATRCDLERVGAWRQLPPGQSAVVCCVHGHKISPSAGATLRAAGTEAGHLEGRIVGYVEPNLPCCTKLAEEGRSWIPCGRLKTDCIAHPWLIGAFSAVLRGSRIKAGQSAKDIVDDLIATCSNRRCDAGRLLNFRRCQSPNRARAARRRR